jgi:methyl acetate hydrolase
MFSSTASIESYLTPLVFEPGTHFAYGIGIDWAGHLVSRISGLTLEEYFQQNIWAPCGIKEISFHPPKDWKKEMMAMTAREPPHTGEIKLLEGTAMGRTYETSEIGPLYSGGGGLFGTARDYLTFLRHVLASASEGSKAGLIKPETFKLLFTDSLPDDPVIRADLASMAEKQCIHDPAILTNGTGDYIAHGPALFLNKKESKWGRKPMSGFWDGAAKTMFWLDPTSGIAVSTCADCIVLQACQVE